MSQTSGVAVEIPEEFRGAYTADADAAIASFVAGVRAANKVMWTSVKGVRLIADPAVREEDYTGQLRWTYHTIADTPIFLDDGQRRRAQWVNLVPEVRAQARQLMIEYQTLEWENARAVLDWLVRFALPAWCRWAVREEDLTCIASQLVRTKPDRVNYFGNPAKPEFKPGAFKEAEELIDAAIVTLSDWHYRHLAEGWLKKARLWVTHNC